jgi:lipoprotein-releasing system ATP-binding protein
MKESRRIDVLMGVDLQIEKGDKIAIVGASGVGKTTLLHIMGTIERPSSGRIIYEGKDIFSLNNDGLAEFRNSNIGFVFQFQHLLPELNALENVMMPALIKGLLKREARGRAEEILREVGIADRMRHKPGELSGGEQQRIAIARALIMEPKAILADEPTGNLDRHTGRQIEDLLIDLNRKKEVTLIIVTHNQELAKRMSRQFALVDGKAIPIER